MNSDTPLPIVADLTGLTRRYRFIWRLKYLGFSIFGPADQPVHRSPKEHLKWQRARKVLAAHEAQGTEAPEEVRLTAERM